MVFWIGILCGAVFAYMAIKIGLYETWVMLFNIIIAVYLAVYLRPIIVDFYPDAGSTPYRNGLTMAATAVAALLILYGISNTFITSQFTVPFPKVLDTLAAGVLGFLAGLLVWSFVSLLICITPISQQPIVREMGFSSQFQLGNASSICRWCNLVNKVASRKDNSHSTEDVISELLKSAEEKKTPIKRDRQIGPDKPPDVNEPAEPNLAPADTNALQSAVSPKVCGVSWSLPV